MQNTVCYSLQLGQLASVLPHAGCYQVTANRTSMGIEFSYRIVPGLCSQSFDIDVALLAGVPHSVTKRAEAIVKHLKEFNSVNQE